ncbi:MAG: hypothetical protein R3D51_03365 [Hyphomicrobiaceae bacterium]
MIRIVLPRRRGVLAIFLVALGPLVSAYFYLHGLRDHLLFLGLDPPVLISASDRFIPETGRTLFLACSGGAAFSASGLRTAPSSPKYPVQCQSVTAEGPILPGQVFAVESTGPFRFIAGEMQIADVTFSLKAGRFVFLILYLVPWLMTLFFLATCEGDVSERNLHEASLSPGTRYAAYVLVLVPLMFGPVTIILHSRDGSVGQLLRAVSLLAMCVLFFGPPLTRGLLGAAHTFEEVPVLGRFLFAIIPARIPAAGVAIVYLVMGTLALTLFLCVSLAAWYAMLFVARVLLLIAFPRWLAPVLDRLDPLL